jgi:hypothetical protein
MQPLNPNQVNLQLDQCVWSFMIKLRKLAVQANNANIDAETLSLLVLDKIISELQTIVKDDVSVNMKIGDKEYSMSVKLNPIIDRYNRNIKFG